VKKTVGRIGYEAYAKSTGGKTYDGRDMPKWRELPPKIRKAWEAATCAAIAASDQDCEVFLVEDDDPEDRDPRGDT
jgi:hypothetical protein